MIRWLIALIVGAVVAWIAYGRAGTALSARTALLAALRGLAVMLVVALLLGAPAGQTRAAPALVAFDASASWLRAAKGDSTLVRDALRAALKEAGSDSVMLTGDSLRMMTSGIALESPIADGQSSLRPAIDRAAALSRPLILLTDGEVDDPSLQADMPAGSRIIVPARTANKDAALSAIESPFTVNAGDTLSVAVVVVAGGAGADSGTVRLLLDGQQVGTSPVTPLGAFASRRSVINLPLPRGAKKSLLQAVVNTGNDAEIRNDTLGMPLDIGDKPAAVFVSTSSLDVREALSVLRGALDVPARAYLRIAPGVWREEGSLRPVTEEDVRSRLQGAGLVIVHGDTSWGGVSTRTRGAHALWVPASPSAMARAGENVRLSEWYVTGAPASPLIGALAGLPWDTLPPITAASPAKGSFTVLEARLGKTGAPVAVIAGRENAGFRTLVISGSGFAGWSLRGGRSQSAFVALWGAMFDWLAAARGDAGAARPATVVARSGEPVRWRRGGSDSLVTAVITRRTPAGNGQGDTVSLRFGNAGAETVSASLPVGVYDVRTSSASAGAASSVLVVNSSRELIPRAPTLVTGAASRGLSAGAGPRLSDLGWMFGLALLLLCAEWLLRRYAGLR